MGMAAYFVPVSPQTLDPLTTDPDRLASFLFPDEDDSDHEPEGSVDVDKAWHGLHFLLHAIAGNEQSPLTWAILGGTEFGDDIGFGPARYLAPTQVAAIARALAEVPTDRLREAFDPEAMTQAAIYPEIWERDGDEALAYLVHFYPTLVSFYAEAALKGMGAVLYLA